MTSRPTLESSAAKELLHKKETGPGPHPPRPLDHIAFSILLDGGASVEESLGVLSRLRQDFVDWNEVRVARTQEVFKVLGAIPDAERVALRLKDEYNAFFDKKGALNFDFLAAGKPAEMRRLLGQLLPHLSKGAVSLLLYEFCAGASAPFSDEGLRQAKKEGIVGKTADRNQLARVLHESLDLHGIALLIQYLELEATGNPYGEAGKREAAANAGKKAKKNAARARTKNQEKR